MRPISPARWRRSGRGQALWGYATASAGLIDRLAVAGARRDRRRVRRRKPWIAAFGAVWSWPVRCALARQAGRSGGGPAGRRVRDRRHRGRIRRRVQQRHDAEPGAAGAARPAVGHRLGGRLCRRTGQPRHRARLPRRQSAERQDPARPHAAVRARSGDARGRPRGRAASALWFIVFVLPLFCSRPISRACVPLRAAVRQGLRMLAGTLRAPAATTATRAFLLANMIYADGLVGAVRVRRHLCGRHLRLGTDRDRHVRHPAHHHRRDRRLGGRQARRSLRAEAGDPRQPADADRLPTSAILSIGRDYVPVRHRDAAGAGRGLFAATAERVLRLHRLVHRARRRSAAGGLAHPAGRLAPPDRITPVLRAARASGKVTSFLGRSWSASSPPRPRARRPAWRC